LEISFRNLEQLAESLVYLARLLDGDLNGSPRPTSRRHRLRLKPTTPPARFKPCSGSWNRPNPDETQLLLNTSKVAAAAMSLEAHWAS